MQMTAVRRDTRAWRFQVWVAFGLATVLCATGLGYVPDADIDRAVMGLGRSPGRTPVPRNSARCPCCRLQSP